MHIQDINTLSIQSPLLRDIASTLKESALAVKNGDKETYVDLYYDEEYGITMQFSSAELKEEYSITVNGSISVSEKESGDTLIEVKDLDFADEEAITVDSVTRGYYAIEWQAMVKSDLNIIMDLVVELIMNSSYYKLTGDDVIFTTDANETWGDICEEYQHHQSYLMN